MTVAEFIHIIKEPHTINHKQMQELDEIVKEYPYFQAARVLQLKMLHTEGDYKYHKALKLAAVHVTNRTILFNFINSKSDISRFTDISSDFQRISKAHERKDPTINEYTPPQVSYIESEPRTFRPKLPDPIFQEDIFPDELINHRELADIFVPKKSVEEAENTQPSWMNRTDTITPTPPPTQYKDENVAEKFKIIDKFLETNPKIEPSKDYVSNVNLADEVKTDEKQLMTETLAQVYVNQRKYKQAIQAYQILILKNPKKSAYFAAEIEKIKKLQQNNL
ncbi:hypothetical protein [Capnocytophaga bilenii]